MSGQERQFTTEYRERVRLEDGTAVEVRCIGPQDAARLQDFVDRLSAHSRINRFHAAKALLTPVELHYLTHVDGERHVALAVTALDGSGALLAVARFVRREESPEVAEVAFAVVDAMQGRGLGGLLLERLAAAARERRVQHFEASVLPGNLAMDRLLAPLRPRRRFAMDGTLSFAMPLAARPQPDGWHCRPRAGAR